MQIIIHRVNTIEKSRKVAPGYGVEIDVRGYGDEILLNHDPIDDPSKYCRLEDFLKDRRHRFVIFNMKEAGYEWRVIELAERYAVEDYFLLDVEFPFLFAATRKRGLRKIAVRYSEAEPVEGVLAQAENGRPLLDWVWIDTNTRLPLDRAVAAKLRGFKTCLVCPERWGRPQDIAPYREFMRQEGIELDAVMTSLECAPLWEEGPIPTGGPV